MIAGIQKLTLLDFPGHTACTVFLAGCNMRGPFCHNAELFGGKVEEVMSTDEFLKFLSTRQGLLDGVCVSGGEPTGDPQLPQLLRAIKDLGFQVKLDTNGSRPQLLQKLLEEKLVDYVAMDVKNSPSRYAQTVGLDRFDMTPIEESLRLLLTGSTPYELRTTVVQQLHDENSMAEMGAWLTSLLPGKKPKTLFLQRFVDRDTVAFSGLCAPEESDLKRFLDTLTPFVEKIALRGG